MWKSIPKNYRYTISLLVLVFISLLIIDKIQVNKPGKPKLVDEYKKSHPGPDLRPFEWAWMKRTFPFFTADTDAHLKALEQAKELRRSSKQKRNANANVEWEFAGPKNIGGRVVDIEFDPLNTNIVYAAAATGGLLKSTDLGQNWNFIFDEQAVLTIGDIGIDPQNSNTIYVGTGEANGGHNNFPGGGIFKSTDGGLTWTHKGLDNTASIGRVIVDPTNSNKIFVAAVGSYFAPNPERGVYISEDGGDQWGDPKLFISDSTGAIDIVVNPSNPNIVFAAMWERVRRYNSSHLYGPTSGIYKSTDGGYNWTELTAANGLPNPSTEDVGRIGLAMCAEQPNVLYALYNDGYEYSGLYKTTDDGETWIDADPDNEINGGTASFSWYFGQVRVHPSDPRIVFVLDVRLMRSYDSGETWSIPYSGSRLHVDHHALTFKPDNYNFIFDGNDGGINYSEDLGSTWSTPANISVTQFYEIGLDYQNPERLYGGTQDNNVIRTTTGSLYDWHSLVGGDGFYVIVDPTNPQIIYAEWQNGNLLKSINGGSNFNTVLNGIQSNDPRNWSTPVVMDPDNPLILYYGTDKIYRTTDGAKNWTAISPVLVNPGGNIIGTVSTIAVAPSNSSVIYAGTDDGNVWLTSNNGTDWSNISSGLPYRWVTRVTVNQTNPEKVYATFSGLRWKDPQPHVFKRESFDGYWIDITSNLPDAPVNAFAIDNNNPNWLYLGSDIGVFVSFNDGGSWEPLGSNIPVVVINDMKIHPTENYLAVGTHGRSMYKLDLDAIVGVEEETESLPTAFTLHQNYPNPFNPTTTISFEIAQASDVSLIIYDLLGREVKTLVNEFHQAGSLKVVWSGKNNYGNNISAGVYFYRLISGDNSLTKKMLLLK